MTPAEIIDGSSVPSQSSQQVRALNVVDALLVQGVVKPTGKIAIIGAGVGGITVAAALAVAAPGMKAIDLFERKGELLHLQRGSQRFVHPHLYDWPKEGSTNADAGLPLLNWHAGKAADVALTLNDQFDALTRGKVNPKIGRYVDKIKLFPTGGCRVFVKGAPAESAVYDAAIISIGFGYENFIEGQNLSYWSPSVLAAPILAAGDRHEIFVSGNGDGGLVDFMMAAFNGLDHGTICQFITNYDGLEDTKRVLLEIEEMAWASSIPIDILAEYRRSVIPILPNHLLSDVRDRLRQDADLYFHTREQFLFRRNTAILNRFGAFLALSADESAFDRIHPIVGKPFEGAVSTTGSIQIQDQLPRSPYYRILRLGEDRAANFAPFHDMVTAFETAHPDMSATRYRPATPELTPTAKARFAHLAQQARFAGAPAVIATASSPQAARRIQITRCADGQLNWGGDVAPDAVGTLWDENVVSLALFCQIPASEAGPLISVLARLCAHTRSTELMTPDRRRWEEVLRGFAGRRLPGPNTGVQFTVRDLTEAPQLQPAITADQEGLSAQIHTELDKRLLSLLNDALFACLHQQPPAEIGWLLQADLRRAMWIKWQVWYQELRKDIDKRRRFLLLLATERDERRTSHDSLVRLGPIILRPHLIRAAAFALVFASCSPEAFSPSATYPGNLLTDRIRGHTVGVSWIEGRDIGPEVAALRWTTGLVLMSELKTAIALLRRQPRLDQLPGDIPSAIELTPAEEPIIVGCDYEFQQALENGVAAVTSLIETVLSDRAQGAADTLESGTP
jgi:hypothetical protein